MNDFLPVLYFLSKLKLETTNYVLVISKAKQYIIFNRDVAEQYDLKNFFKKKIPSIRIQE